MLKNKQAYETKAQIYINIWKGFKKGQSMWNNPNKQQEESRLGFLGKCMRAWDLFKTLTQKRTKQKIEHGLKPQF